MAEQHPFEYQPPTPEQVARITRIREGCKDLHDLLLRELPPCRERSVAITNLEQVSMWANKGVVFNPGFAMPPPPPDPPDAP